MTAPKRPPQSEGEGELNSQRRLVTILQSREVPIGTELIIDHERSGTEVIKCSQEKGIW